MSIVVGAAPPAGYAALVGGGGPVQVQSQSPVPCAHRSSVDGRRNCSPVEHLCRQALGIPGPSALHFYLAGGVLAGADLLSGSAGKSEFYDCRHTGNFSTYFSHNL